LTEKFQARARLTKDFQFSLDDGRSHSVVVDLPTDTEEGVGPTSLELCAMSHAGCYSQICALTAKKMRITLTGVDVKVQAIKTDDAGTMTEENFSIMIKSNAPKDRIERLHELTIENCPVGKIFEKAGVKLTYEVKMSNK
jgi:uncharacterized OsmC-like protein